MKLGEVLKKERTRKQLSVEKVAADLGMPSQQYEDFEAGQSSIEVWGPKLALFAIKLSTPTSRLISKTGKSSGAKLEEGQCGKLIRAHRERRGFSVDQLAKELEISTDEVIEIESGKSPLESYAPALLRYAEIINQPIFNLFYPCGLPLDKLQDYP
jgi:transcriptional regulator with XRE-family HTH domain